MDKALILAAELKRLRERVAALAAIPMPLEGKEGPRGLSGASGEQGRAGAAGDDGKDGKDGKPGDDGKQGLSIVDAEVDFDGTLSFTLSDGSSIKTTTEIIGPQGVRGIPGAKGLGVTSGTAQLDFGSSSTVAETVVTGVSEAFLTSRVTAVVRVESTPTHSVDDLLVDPIRVLVKSIVAGEGFTIYGQMDNARANGIYKIDWFVSN